MRYSRFPTHSRSKKTSSYFPCTCFAVVIYTVTALAMGGWSVNYILALFGEKLPMIPATIVGLFVSYLTIPASIAIAILKYYGVM